MIIALEDAKYKLLALRDDIKELGSALRIDELRNNVAELEKQTLDADFWNNQENSSRVLQTIKQTKDKIEGYDALHNRLEDAIALAEMAIEENAESSVPEVQAELDAINRDKEERRTEILAAPRHRTGHKCCTA